MLENVERKGQNIIWQGKYKEDNGKRKDGNSKGKQDTKDGDKKERGNNQQPSPVNNTSGCTKKNISRIKKK